MSKDVSTGKEHVCVEEVELLAEEIYPKVKALIDPLKDSLRKLDEKIAKYNAEIEGDSRVRGPQVKYKITNNYNDAVRKLDEQFGKLAEEKSDGDGKGNVEAKMQEMDYLLSDWMSMLMASQSKAFIEQIDLVYENAGPDQEQDFLKLPPKALVYLNQMRTLSGGKPGQVRDSEVVAWCKENSAIWQNFLKDEISDGATVADPNSPLGLSTQIVELVKEFQLARDACTAAIQHTDLGGMMERTGDYWLNKMGLMSDEELKNKYAEADAAAKAFDKLFPSQLKGDYAERYVFRHQCFLLAKIDELSDYKKLVIEKKNPKGLPYDVGTSGFGNVNACLMADGDPYGFLNRLTQHPNQSAFFNMKTDEISNLQPMIKLYKIIRNKNGTEEQQRIFFDSYASGRDVENIFKEKKRRGFGVGIKDFKFTYDGNNPFAAKKSISAELTIFANSFQELLEDHRGFKYVDLAMKTGGKKIKAAATADGEDSVNKANPKCPSDDEIDANLRKLNFRLKALVGWAMPGDRTTIGSAVFDALNDSFITLNLTPTTHEFNFDQQGRVNFTIKYLAYVEDFFDQPNFNVFTNTKITEQQIHRKLKYNYWTDEDDCGAERIAADKKKLLGDGTIEREKKESLSTFITTMMATGRIYYITMNENDIASFKKAGPYFKEGKKLKIHEDAGNTKNLSKKLDDALGSALDPKKTKDASVKEIKLEVDTALANIKSQNIAYFYVSDLIDVILASIERNLERLPKRLARLAADKNVSGSDVQREVDKYKAFHQQFKKFRVLMGPLEIIRPDQASTFVNFGDVPISLKYFMSWLTGQTLKRDQVVYPLPKFLNDLFNNLLREFLNNDDCFSTESRQRTRLNQASVTSYKDGELDEFTALIRSISNELDPKGEKRLSRLPINIVEANKQPILNTSGVSRTPIKDGGVEKETNFLIYFAGRTQPTELMKGERQFDEQRGIFHYILGKPHGIVKTVDLERTNTPGLKETRFMQEGYDDLEQLREVYNIKIKTYANVHTFPGTYIFLDPRGFAPDMTVLDDSISDLTKYGIGGYHMIWKSEHSFGTGRAESTIHAKWVAQIDYEEECRQKGGDNQQGGTEKAKKCKARHGGRKSAASGGGLLDKIMGAISNAMGDATDNVGAPPTEDSGESP